MNRVIPTEAGDINISITRKRIKNLYLRVTPPDGRVSVSAPLSTSDAEIERFVLSRADWVAGQREKMTTISPRRYRTGECLPYFGKQLTLSVVPHNGRTKVLREGQTLTLFIKPDADENARKRAIDGWYRLELIEAAGAMLPACERTVGKQAGELRVRDMKTRWGTCNTRTAMITINLRLTEKPAECLRYVLIHELCHLHEPGHDARFWKRMNQYYPDWKRVRKLLRTRDEQ
jgi:predicted metal-dependent hydrolase